MRYRKRSIADMVALPVARLGEFFRDLETSGREAEIARDLVAELKSRLSFLSEVGLAYLALDKDSRPGKLVFNRTITLKDAWAKETKK